MGLQEASARRLEGGSECDSTQGSETDRARGPNSGSQRANQKQRTERRRRQDPTAPAERKRGGRSGRNGWSGAARSAGDERLGRPGEGAGLPGRTPRGLGGAAPGPPRWAQTRARAGPGASEQRLEAGGTADPAPGLTSDSAAGLASLEAARGLRPAVSRMSTPVGPGLSGPGA